MKSDITSASTKKMSMLSGSIDPIGDLAERMLFIFLKKKQRASGSARSALFIDR